MSVSDVGIGNHIKLTKTLYTEAGDGQLNS